MGGLRFVGSLLLAALLATLLPSTSASLAFENFPPFAFPVSTSASPIALARDPLNPAGPLFIGIPGIETVGIILGGGGENITTPQSGIGFGSSVAVSAGLLAVGAPLADNGKGAVYIYSCTGTSCTGPDPVTISDAVDGDHAGYSVALSGNVLLVGAPDAGTGGKVYAFDCTNEAACQLLETINNPLAQSDSLFGYSVAACPSSGYLLAGAPEGNRAYIFTCDVSGETCTTPDSLDAPIESEMFGSAFACYGNNVYAGAPGGAASQGRVQPFQCPTFDNCDAGDVIMYSEGGNNDGFGNAISATEHFLAVGATGILSDAGGVVIFSAGDLEEKIVIDLSGDGQIGQSVILAEPYVFFGAPHLNSNNGGILIAGLTCAAENDSDHADWSSALLGEASEGTCEDGYYAAAPTRQCGFDGILAAATDPCVENSCAAGEDETATWPAALPGEYGFFECKDGYSAGIEDDAELAQCLGEPASYTTNPCERLHCEAGSDATATWLETEYGQLGEYTCKPGYYAHNKTLECGQNGPNATWIGANPCQPVYCEEGEDDAATWTVTLSGTSSEFTCKSGYYAEDTEVDCIQNEANATWSTNPCQPVYCDAGEDDTATWEQTLSGISSEYTCKSGYYAANPQVACTQDEDSATWGTNPCQPVYCEAGGDAAATWNRTLAGTSFEFTCKSGYYAMDTEVDCVQDEDSAAFDTNPCQPVYCTAGEDATATWEQTLSGTSSEFTCKSGYYAMDTEVDCVQDEDSAAFDTNPCQPVYCAAGEDATATWEQTLSGTSSEFTCKPGYYAMDTEVDCIQDEDSAAFDTNPCQPVYCAAGEDATATWEQTQAGETGHFSCKVGYYAANASVECTPNGVNATWGANPCAPVRCAAETAANAAWAQTLAGTTATGTCLAGFTGTSTRACEQIGPLAVWSDVQNPCSLPPAGSSASTVQVTFYIRNLEYSWVVANADNRKAFEDALKANLAAILGVHVNDVTITDLAAGSVIVGFTLKTDNEEVLRTKIADFFGSSNPALDFSSLPSDALENNEMGTPLDANQSSVKPNNTGAIVGGIIGGLVGLAIFIVIIVVVARRRKDRGFSKTKDRVSSKEQVEMID